MESILFEKQQQQQQQQNRRRTRAANLLLEIKSFGVLHTSRHISNSFRYNNNNKAMKIGWRVYKCVYKCVCVCINFLRLSWQRRKLLFTQQFSLSIFISFLLFCSNLFCISDLSGHKEIQRGNLP